MRQLTHAFVVVLAGRIRGGAGLLFARAKPNGSKNRPQVPLPISRIAFESW